MGRMKLSRRELVVEEGGPSGGGDSRPDDGGGVPDTPVGASWVKGR